MQRLRDQRGQDVVEYAGVLVLVAALVAAVASLGLGAKIARAATCEIQQIEQNSCSAATIGTGGRSVSAARSTAEAHSVGHRQHQQAVHMHTAAASRRVPTALAKLQHDAAFFRTGKGSLVALALARKVASQACDANDGDMLGPSYLCSAGQYTSNELAVYHALQNGRNIGGLSLTEPSFDTSVGFWNPVTLLTSVAAGPVGDLITNIAGTLTKDGIQQAAPAVAGLLGKQELTADASLQQTLAASGDLPSTGGGGFWLNGRYYPPIAGGARMLGEGGVQTTSTTLLGDTGQGFRIDVENPAPGVRPGQLHLQASGEKYLYNFETNTWEGLPSGLARRVAKDPGVAKAIAKARRYLNVPKS